MATFALYITKPKVKIVLHWHSDIIKQKFLLFFYSPFLKWLIKKSDIIITTSPIYASKSKYLCNQLNKVTTVPLGSDIDCNSYDIVFYNKLKQDFKNKKILLSIGRLSYYKGYNYLIDAINYIDDTYVLLIMGDGHLMFDLQKKINELNLTKKVILLGSLNNLQKNSLYKVCDIFILGSFYKTEAFGIVQIEAMAFGKPVISTNIDGSGVPWVNKDGTSGIVVPIQDPLAISKAILQISNDKILYDRYSKGAFDRFNENFKLEIMINKILFIYHNLLK
jgi:rhamnosyl/mannosyltransferase